MWTPVEQASVSPLLASRRRTVWIFNRAVNTVRTSKWRSSNKSVCSEILHRVQNSEGDSRTWPHRCSDIFRVRSGQKDTTPFSLQKDVELVCGFILSSLSFVHRKFCLPCWRTSQHKYLSLYSEPITVSEFMSPCRMSPYTLVQREARMLENTMPQAVLLSSAVKWQSPGRNWTPRHSCPLHYTCTALWNERTHLEYIYEYVSRFILVMLFLLSSVVASLIALSTIYHSVPHRHTSCFFLCFIK
jgi:hypothetical protein